MINTNKDGIITLFTVFYTCFILSPRRRSSIKSYKNNIYTCDNWI